MMEAYWNRFTKDQSFYSETNICSSRCRLYQRSLRCVWSNYSICLPEKTTHSCSAFWCFHYSWRYFEKIVANSITLSRNLSVGHARTRSAQYDWVSLIALATDLPHEIESKRQPVHQPANSIEDDARGKKTRAKPRKTRKIESVLLCRTTTSHNYFITSTSQQLCDTVRVNMNSVLFFSYFFFRKERVLLPLCIQFSTCTSMQEPKGLGTVPSSLCGRLV